MTFSISTRWNASRHNTAEAMIDEILKVGINHVELGYDLRPDFVAPLKRMVADRTIVVGSVHNYCPVPPVAAEGHPELFTLPSRNRRVRESALLYTRKTIYFAAEMGAKIVVIHGGNVGMKNITSKLIQLCENGKRYGNAYEKTKHKLMVAREKKVQSHLKLLYQGLQRLMPVLQETGIRLGLENLPSWEAIPTETECRQIISDFGARYLCYWHDFGHAQIRENLGLINHMQSLAGLRDVLGGMHIHDVIPPARDHVMPPSGMIDFNAFREFGNQDVIRVLEPSPRLPAKDLRIALEILHQAWAWD